MQVVDSLIEPFEAPDDGGSTAVYPHTDSDTPPFSGSASTEAELIAETLAWCAELFGVESARLVRPLASGHWTVLTWRRDGVLAYAADYAETAMAWMVGLGRQALIVNRPRVSQGDDGRVRPISTRTYVGLPVMCQDRLIGVVEIAVGPTTDIETALSHAMPRLGLIARRIVHDPALRAIPPVTPASRCALDGAAAFGADIVLTPAERQLLSALGGGMTVAALSLAHGLELDETVLRVAELAARGLVAVEDSSVSLFPRNG